MLCLHLLRVGSYSFDFTIEQVTGLLYDTGRRVKIPTTGPPFGLSVYIAHY